MIYTEEHLAQYKGDWSKPTPLAENPEDDSAPLIAKFGNWYISTDGDLMFKRFEDKESYYSIWYHQLNQDNWVLHLTTKIWFTPECYEDFKRAYFVACKIAGVGPTKQIRDYSERKR